MAAILNVHFVVSHDLYIIVRQCWFCHFFYQFPKPLINACLFPHSAFFLTRYIRLECRQYTFYLTLSDSCVPYYIIFCSWTVQVQS